MASISLKRRSSRVGSTGRYSCGADMYHLSLSAHRPFFTGYFEGKRVVLATQLIHCAMRSWLEDTLTFRIASRCCSTTAPCHHNQ
mgnify:CR=1 FL=1